VKWRWSLQRHVAWCQVCLSDSIWGILAKSLARKETPTSYCRQSYWTWTHSARNCKLALDFLYTACEWRLHFMASLPNGVGRRRHYVFRMTSISPPHLFICLFVRSSRQTLLPRYLMNGWSNLDFGGQRLRSQQRRGCEGSHVEVGTSKSTFWS